MEKLIDLKQFAGKVARKALRRSSDDNGEYVIVGKRGVIFAVSPLKLGWRYGGTFPDGREIPTTARTLDKLLRTYVKRFGGDGSLECFVRGDTEAILHFEPEQFDLVLKLAQVRKRGSVRGIALLKQFQTDRRVSVAKSPSRRPVQDPCPRKGVKYG